MLFRDRADAGQHLATQLTAYAGNPDVLVLGLPRGGVPVAFQVAQILRVPLDIFVVRKLGVPGQEELAMGAIASGHVRVLNREIIRALKISETAIDAVTEKELPELERREHQYRDDRPFPTIRDKTVILVDDGLATGSSMRAAVRAVQAHNPSRLIVAVPVAAQETCDAFVNLVDQVVCGRTPDPFFAVGAWYHDFSQTTDEEVRHLLQLAWQAPVSR